MKNVLRNWKGKLQIRNWSQLCHSSGGTSNYFIGVIIFYSLLTIYNLFTAYIIGATNIQILLYCAPFLLFIILLAIPKREIFDISIEIILMILVTITVENNGDFSGVSLLLILFFRSKNKWHYYILFALLLISLSFSSISYNRAVPETLNIIILFGLMIFKFYHVVIKPHQELKALIQFKDTVIDNLQNRLSIMGPRKKLTDAEIIDKYRFLRYSRTDRNGNDDPYRKLTIMRMLSDGYEYKEVCSELMIKDLNTLARTLKTIRKELSVRIDGTIANNTQLVKECIKLGIIHVDITP